MIVPGLTRGDHARGRRSGLPYVRHRRRGVAAFLMVGTIAGILMATFFNNSGGAWDNAKKFIESGSS